MSKIDWILIFTKGRRVRSDLKAKQCNAFRIMTLQWPIGNLQHGASCKFKHHFICMPQLFHTGRPLESQLQDDMEMYAETLLLKVICKAMALSKERAPHTKFITISSTFPFVCEADQSGWCFVFHLFSDCFVSKATFDTSMMKYTLKMLCSGVGNMHAGPATKQQKRLYVWLCLLQGTLVMYPVGVQVNDTKCCVSNMMFQLHWFHSLQGLANTYSVDSYQWKGKKSCFRCFYTQENGTLISIIQGIREVFKHM